MASETWVFAPLRDFVTFINGDRSTNYPSTEDNDSRGLPFVSATELINGKLEIDRVRRISEVAYDRLDSGKFAANDVLFCLRGSVGKLAPVPDGLLGAVASSLVIVRANIIDPHFLLYLMSSPEFQRAVRTRDNGSVQGNVSVKELGQLPVRVPDAKEQKAIVASLSPLDERIGLISLQNRVLEAIARGIFKSWFVDFDPVRAKVEGREPEGMDAATAALFPCKFQDSTLGSIPICWKIGRVCDLGAVICGKTPPTAVRDYYGDEVPFITIPDMNGRVFAHETTRRLSVQGAEFQRSKYLPPRSICVSCIATVGLVTLTSERSQTNQQINSVVPNQEFPSCFSFFILRNLGEEIRSAGSGGSVFGNLNKSRFESLTVLLPPPSLAHAYSSLVTPLFDKILLNLRVRGTLTELRDTLLPRLISGKLRVPEAEKLVEAVI
ncbi:MAG: restriction endonuclease subunit S [Acidobacteriaceae bacterium]